jgi:hypothetical protein
MSVEILGTPRESMELSKRTYVPGVVLRSVCPKCMTPWEQDLGRECLSYPTIGEPHNVGGYCSKCQHEWPVMVIVRLTIEAAP